MACQAQTLYYKCIDFIDLLNHLLQSNFSFLNLFKIALIGKSSKFCISFDQNHLAGIFSFASFKSVKVDATGW